MLSDALRYQTNFLDHAGYKYKIKTVQRVWHLLNNVEDTVRCPVCAVAPLNWDTYKKGYRQYCSNRCEHDGGLTIQKRKQSSMAKYGVPCTAQAQEVKDKVKVNSLQKYGVEHSLQRPEIREKIKQTCLGRYGSTTPAGNVDVATKRNVTQFLHTYQKLLTTGRLQELVRPLFTAEEYVGGNHTHIYKWECTKCGNKFESKLYWDKVPRCLNCFPREITRTSKYELELETWLRDIGVTIVERNTRKIIAPLELDIYLPDHNIAVEFNGLWSHSENSGNKDNSYHLNKTKRCQEQGITLIHIFEDEWLNKQEIVKSIIKNKLGLTDNKIYARNCSIKEVDKKEAQQFLAHNHMQGTNSRCSSYIGLHQGSSLLQLAGVGKSRFSSRYDYELIRMCTKLNHTVVGGFQKLTSYISQKVDGSIVSYVDRRWFDGGGYKNWKPLGESVPGYFYTDYESRESRMKYQKHKLQEFPEYKPELTEWQIMQSKGYDRIWDCGNLVFVLEKRT